MKDVWTGSLTKSSKKERKTSNAEARLFAGKDCISFRRGRIGDIGSFLWF